MTRWTRYWVIYAAGSCFGVVGLIHCYEGKPVPALMMLLGMLAVYAVNIRLLNGAWRL